MDAPTDRTSILLVDDRPANLVALQAVLDRPEYHLVLAGSGQEALAQLPKHDLAVILLDVAMPDMDGFATATAIRKQPEHANIPIIFITAVTEDLGWIYRAYEVGAVDFLEKPLNAHAVRAKVKFFVQLHVQRKQIERQQQQIRDQERALHEMRFRNLAESIPHIVWVASPSGDVEYVNRRWQTWTGKPAGNALGQGWLDATPDADRPRVQEAWDRGISSRAAFEFELPLVNRQGNPRWSAMRALPEDDGRGRVSRWLGTLTDIDEQRQLRDELAASVQQRDEFITIAGHELRTPLSAMKLRLGSMERRATADADETKRNVRLVAKQTDRLVELVERLLDVSRMGSAQLDLQLEPVDLADLARDAVERLSEEASRAGCTVNLKVPASVPGVWDRLRLDQVLVNLLSNAFKYGPRKPIDVTIEADDRMAHIRVEDEGIGIPADAVDRIFGRFERAVSSHNYGGLGLGLYLVARIVEAHGGTVRAESRPEQGTRFLVELPREPTAAARPVTPATPSASGGR